MCESRWIKLKAAVKYLCFKKSDGRSAGGRSSREPLMCDLPIEILGLVKWPIGVSETQAGAAAKARGARESKPPSIRRTRRLHTEAPSLLYSTKGSEYRALGSQLCFMETMR